MGVILEKIEKAIPAINLLGALAAFLVWLGAITVGGSFLIADLKNSIERNRAEIISNRDRIESLSKTKKESFKEANTDMKMIENSIELLRKEIKADMRYLSNQKNK